MGKTALLESAAAAAERAGTRVIRVACAEFLLDVTYASLAALLQPLMHHMPELEPRQQQLIAGLLGGTPEAVDDYHL
jgi:hypothetical protein